MLTALAFASLTPAKSQTADECPTQTRIVGELLRGLNAIRAEPRRCGAIHYGAAPALTWSDGLFLIAQQHAADMVRRHYFSHNTPEGLTPGKRADRAGYDWRYFGENIGLGQTSVEDLLNAWLRSPDHCRAMMEKDFRDVALACATANGQPVWVMDLGVLRSSPSRAHQRVLKPTASSTVRHEPR